VNLLRIGVAGAVLLMTFPGLFLEEENKEIVADFLGATFFGIEASSTFLVCFGGPPKRENGAGFFAGMGTARTLGVAFLGTLPNTESVGDFFGEGSEIVGDDFVVVFLTGGVPKIEKVGDFLVGLEMV